LVGPVERVGQVRLDLVAAVAGDRDRLGGHPVGHGASLPDGARRGGGRGYDASLGSSSCLKPCCMPLRNSRWASPTERASLGSLLPPNSTRTTRRTIISSGAPRFMAVIRSGRPARMPADSGKP